MFIRDSRQFLHNHGIPESEEIGKLKIYEIAGDMNTQKDRHERCKDILHGGSRSFVAHHPSKVSKNILEMCIRDRVCLHFPINGIVPQWFDTLAVEPFAEAAGTLQGFPTTFWSDTG